MHSGYEGMILKGRMLAIAFLGEFTSYTIPSEFLNSDVATLFPWNPCPDGGKPSDGNFCWIDYRDDSVKGNSGLCTVSSGAGSSSTGNGGNSEMDSAAPAGGRMSISSLATAMGVFMSLS